MPRGRHTRVNKIGRRSRPWENVFFEMRKENACTTHRGRENDAQVKRVTVDEKHKERDKNEAKKFRFELLPSRRLK